MYEAITQEFTKNMLNKISGELDYWSGFACLTFTACAQAPLTMPDPSMQKKQSMSTLELQDSAMFVEEISGKAISGSALYHSEVSPSVRTLNVSPGTYHISLAYEHLGQPKCWDDETSTHCWKMQDRGWWLPGTTLIPATIKWVAEPGKTYSLTRVEEYWSMTEQPAWQSKAFSMTEKS